MVAPASLSAPPRDLEKTRRASALRALFAHAALVLGATSSTLGAVGCLEALRHPSLVTLAAGLVTRGVGPFVLGIFLVWRGLDGIEAGRATSPSRARP